MKNVLHDVCTHLYQNTGKFSYGVIERSTFVEDGGGGRFIEKITKTGLGGSYHVCTFAFLKKNAEIFKIKFYSYSPFFPLIIITVKIIKQIIMKDNNIQSCQ